MNRINDSLQLFTMICSNELLKKVHLVLFLSQYYYSLFLYIKSLLTEFRFGSDKTDVLKQKLAAGVHVKR